MTDFYDHDGVRVTDRYFAAGGFRWPVDDLSNLRVARGRRDRTARRAARTAAASALVVATLAPHVPAAVSMIELVLLVVVPALVALVRARLARRLRMLWADHRGATVQLFASRDETEFGKISRALARAAHARQAVGTFSSARRPTATTRSPTETCAKTGGGAAR